MGKHRKTWTSSEKLEVLNYQKLHGSTRASREYGVSVTSILKWRNDYETDGELGLQGKRKSKGESQEFKRIKRENERLKKLVVEKELTILIQNEMLKKSQ